MFYTLFSMYALRSVKKKTQVKHGIASLGQDTKPRLTALKTAVSASEEQHFKPVSLKFSDYY